MSDSMEKTTRLVDRWKTTILEGAAVIIACLSMLTVLVVGILLGAISGTALYAANDAKEETEVTQIYMQNVEIWTHQVYKIVTEKGLEIPEPPEREKEK